MKRVRLAYKEEAMANAINAVENNKMSRRTAAKIFQVPRTTLRDKLSNKTPKERRMGPRPFLTSVEEKEIVDWIVTASKRGLPPCKNEIFNTVQRIINSDLDRAMKTPFIQGRPGQTWWKSFLKRHPNLAIRTPERVSRDIARTTEPVIQNWFDKLHNYLASINQLSILNEPQQIFNTHETSIFLCPNARKVPSVKDQKNLYEVTAGSEKTSLTVVGTFGANGDVIAPTKIYPYQCIPTEIINKIQEAMTNFKTKSRRMKSDAFLDFITNAFHSYLIEHNVKKPVILFVDGHCSHTSMQLSITADELGIIIYLLHPNTTHIMQLTDIEPFKPLKDYWKDLIHNFQVTNSNVTVRKQDVAPLVKEAFARIKSDTIKNAFRVCGLYPFNQDNVDYSKCLEIETDSEEEDEMSEEMSAEGYKIALKVIQKELGPVKKNLCEKQINLDATDLYRLYATVSLKSRVHNDDSILEHHDNVVDEHNDDVVEQHHDDVVDEHNDDVVDEHNDDVVEQHNDDAVDDNNDDVVEQYNYNAIEEDNDGV